ncbi:uncharacterized protein METZ01_LOCUS402591, partial [marine metagenome]
MMTLLIAAAGSRHAVSSHTADSGSPSCQADHMAVTAIGDIPQRESCARICPGQLPRSAIVAKRLGRHGPTKPSDIGITIVTCLNKAQRSVRRDLHRIQERITHIACHVS